MHMLLWQKNVLAEQGAGEKEAKRTEFIKNNGKGANGAEQKMKKKKRPEAILMIITIKQQ